MIKSISLSRLNAAIFYQYMQLINGIALAANPATTKIKSKHDVYAALLVRLLAAFNREKAYELTKQIDKLDAERDALISGFVFWIKGLARHPNPAIQAAAKRINTYLKSFGNNIAGQNQQSESASLTKIVNDFKTDAELKACLTALKDTEWMPALETSNNNFIAIYQQRSSQMGADASAETFIEVRKLTVDAYLQLTDLINTRLKAAMEDGSDATALKKCVDDINATIDQYKILIATTQKRSEDDKEGEGK